MIYTAMRQKLKDDDDVAMVGVQQTPRRLS